MEAAMKEFTPVKEGKVREIYDVGDALIMVATDRISAFDHILKNTITKKGEVLTKMSAFWFDLTKDLIPNHMISIDAKDMPEFFSSEEFSKQLEEASIKGFSTLTFIIGGSLGLAQDVKKRANLSVSFGRLTLPHQLMRLVLVEQIYRAFTIQQGSPYHK